jgi:hypothetical protein
LGVFLPVSGQSSSQKPVFVKSISPTSQYTLTLSAGELEIEHGDEGQTINSADGFQSEKGEVGSISWSNDGHFFLISCRAGAHDQYLKQNLYQCEEIGFGKYRAWSFQEVNLIHRLGVFALTDPDHGEDRWSVADIKFEGADIIADLWPIGHNSHPFDYSSDHYYKVDVIFSGGNFRVMQIIREPGETSKEPAKIVWEVRPESK